MSKCPPGVICIENVSMFMLLLIVFSISYIIYYMFKDKNKTQPDTNIYISSQSNQPESIHDPYKPPLKSNLDFFPQIRQPTMGLPINIATQSVDTNYKQMGILTRGNNGETILPLMGRPLHTNRNKWQYYTISDQNQGIKLPVSRSGRSCTNEYGCDELYNSDTIYVEGYKEAFKVTMYENALPRYIPYV